MFNTVGTGVSLKNIRDHVLKVVPGLRDVGIGRDSIHLLMKPPRKNTVRASRYKSLVDARVPRKRNNYREENGNQHFLFARVLYREEFVAKFNKECVFLSCDDMNKIKMGPATAVSRYHQQFRFFMTDDSPDFADHDFPNPGYLITCSGYQILQQKESIDVDEVFTDPDLNDFTQHGDLENQSEIDMENRNENNSEFFFDKIGRKHYQRFTSGPALLTLRACKFVHSTAATHINDLKPIIEALKNEGKGIFFIKVDNGPDWNLLNLVNELYFFRLWRDLGLDVLGIVSYAAKYSAYNNIEHLWSPMSRKLSSVVLPSVLEGDDLPPYKQTDLSKQEIVEKEAEVCNFFIICSMFP